MNETNQPPTPPAVPSGTATYYGPRPLGDDPAERAAITSVIGAIEAILRQPRRLLFQLRQPDAGRLIGFLFLVSLACSLVYGVVVGTFSGDLQLWAAPVKIAAGLMVSALICLPSLYIFTCLSGSQARLPEVVGMVAGLLALMTILLVGFAPVAWIFSQSTESLAWMGALHLIFWFVATIFGLRFLHTGFAHSNARSQSGFQVWTVIFLLVALQMTTALRPLVGTADTLLPTQKKFFVSHWFDCMKSDSSRARQSGSETNKP